MSIIPVIDILCFTSVKLIVTRVLGAIVVLLALLGVSPIGKAQIGTKNRYSPSMPPYCLPPDSWRGVMGFRCASQRLSLNLWILRDSRTTNKSISP
jgi:hypothetical protein